MTAKFIFVKTHDDAEIERKEFETLTAIADYLQINYSLVRQINKVSDGRVQLKKHHYCNGELYKSYKIYSKIKKPI